MTRPLVILGGGGHGREIAGIVADINRIAPAFHLLGVLADGRWDAAALDALGLRRLGPVADLESMDVDYVIGIGDGGARRRLDEFATGAGRRAASLMHPMATVGQRVECGPGFIAFPGAHVTTEVTFGRHVHLNLNASVSHDCVVESYVTLSPGAVLAGRVRVGHASTVGMNASVLPDVTVGPDAMVGAGAVVVRDVLAGTVVAGVPARPLTQNQREPSRNS